VRVMSVSMSVCVYVSGVCAGSQYPCRIVFDLFDSARCGVCCWFVDGYPTGRMLPALYTHESALQEHAAGQAARVFKGIRSGRCVFLVV